MTVWARLVRRPPRTRSRTESWDTPDRDRVQVVRIDAARNAPRVVLLHGLEGSPDSPYAAALLSACADRGWGADLLVFRTCNGVMNKARRTYHSGETEDLDFVVRRVAREYPRAAVGLVGISLGANVLLKWLGEQADGIDRSVRAAVAVSTPFDLERASRHVTRGFARVYQRRFLRSLRRKALAKIDRFPDLASRDRVAAARTLWQFDDAFTSIVHGFRDARDYYTRSSAIGFLQAIRVPTLLLSARDDPFLPPDVLDHVERLVEGNPHLSAEFHARGGHVGFVEGVWPWRARYYLEGQVTDFLSRALE
jgi:predicted alpha/beta-fold hydrolase